MLTKIFQFFEEENKLSWFITFVGFGLIFYISSLTFGSGEGGLGIMSYLYHLLSFFFVALFFFICVFRGKFNFKIFSLSFLVLISYAILDEFHQYFVPGRVCCIEDVLIDSLGILFAFIVYSFRLIIEKSSH